MISPTTITASSRPTPAIEITPSNRWRPAPVMPAIVSAAVSAITMEPVITSGAVSAKPDQIGVR